jgi:hypothetical protein
MATENAESNKNNVDVNMGRNTDGTFYIRIESDGGITEVKLTAENYAKASVGIAVKGTQLS